MVKYYHPPPINDLKAEWSPTPVIAVLKRGKQEDF